VVDSKAFMYALSRSPSNVGLGEDALDLGRGGDRRPSALDIVEREKGRESTLPLSDIESDFHEPRGNRLLPWLPLFHSLKRHSRARMYLQTRMRRSFILHS